jgi:hypothetical protein
MKQLIFENRRELLSILNSNLVIAELGVFKGEFSENILNICKPSQLVLIDNWLGNVVSGDENGNNLTSIDGAELFDMVTKKFENLKNVKIYRNNTEKILDFEDSFFDMIYIDADHSYESVRIDLQNSYLKIKDGGLIMGHDYEMNENKTKNIFNFGVKRAVDEFCNNYNQQIVAFALDGYTSYAIKINKNKYD